MLSFKSTLSEITIRIIVGAKHSLPELAFAAYHARMLGPYRRKSLFQITSNVRTQSGYMKLQRHRSECVKGSATSRMTNLL